MAAEFVFEQAQTLQTLSKASLCSLCGEFYKVLSWKKRRCKQPINLKKLKKKEKSEQKKE